MQSFLTAIDVNRRVDELPHEYGRCKRCGLTCLTTPPEDLERYYSLDYYRAPSQRRLRWAAWRERYQIDLVLDHVKEGRLVDVGAAWGTFALQARNSGFDVTAIEADNGCCDYLRSVVGVEAACSTEPGAVLDGLPPSNVVTMWQVVEHLRDPWEVLDHVANNLDDRGVLILSTPNPDALSFRLLAARWPHIDAPRHQWLIPAPVLVAFLQTRGLACRLLTTRDTGGRRWNHFTWRRVFLNQTRRRRYKLVAELTGRLVALILRPLESREGSGSCYTAVFARKSA